MSQGQADYPDELADPPTESFEESRGTRVVLELSPAGDCFMDHLDGAIVDVEADYVDGMCQCDVTVCGRDGDCGCGGYDCECEEGDSDDGDCEVLHVTRPICDCCPGVVFSEYGCVPRILERKDGSFVIATYVSSVDVVSDLVSELRGACSQVEVRSLVNTDACEGSAETREVDLSHLTAKQRDSLARAVAAGYYDTPQAASLEELAAEFGISSSALSQRLGRAEEAVLSQIFDDE